MQIFFLRNRYLFILIILRLLLEIGRFKYLKALEYDKEMNDTNY